MAWNRARELRRASTKSEDALWQVLRDRRLLGLKFRRQHPVGRYALDFYCPDLLIAVEADGKAHEDEGAIERDAARDRFLLDECGIRTLRVSAVEVEGRLEGVVAWLTERLEATATQVPPLHRNGEGAGG